MKDIARKVIVIFSLLLFPTLSVQLQQSPPHKPPQDILDEGWYVPGEVHEFRASVYLDSKGNQFTQSTHEVTKGIVQPMWSWTSGIYRGDAVIWFSGNAAVGRGESYLTSSSSLRINTCAQVIDFHANNGQGQSSDANRTCMVRTIAYDPVRTSDHWLWSGCTIVFFPGNMITNNLTHHVFNQASGFSDARVDYRCTP